MPAMIPWSMGFLAALALAPQDQPPGAAETTRSPEVVTRNRVFMTQNTDTPSDRRGYKEIVTQTDATNDRRGYFPAFPLPFSHQRQDQRYAFTFTTEGAGSTSGMTISPVDPATRAHLKIPAGQGLIVTSLVPGGAASEAGIVEHDILLALNDAPLGKVDDLEERLKSAGDKPASLVVLHRGAKKTIQVQPQVHVSFGPVRPEPPAYWIGITVAPLDPALRAQLAIAPEQGLLATDVVPDGPAGKSGVKSNDILLSLGRKPLTDQAKLVELVQANGEKDIVLEILREGTRQEITLLPARRKQGLNKIGVQIKANPLHYDVVRPGFVQPGQMRGFAANPNDPVRLWDLTGQSLGTGPNARPDAAAKRLDEMAGEIKQLRKALEDLSKAIKERN